MLHYFSYYQYGRGTPSLTNIRRFARRVLELDNNNTISIIAGTYDSQNKKLVLTHAINVFRTFSTYTLGTSTNRSVFRFDLPGDLMDSEYLSIACSSALVNISTEDTAAFREVVTTRKAGYGNVTRRLLLYVPISIYSTGESFSQYLLNNPIEYVYKLETPSEYTLTASEERRLYGLLGIGDNFSNGKLLLNSLMAQAQGRDLSQSRGDVEPTRTAISLDPIKPNLDIMEENENAAG